jgi:hypothetical protein
MPTCLPLREKKATEFFLSGRNFCPCQENLRSEVPCFSPFMISTGRRRSILSFMWCRLREEENERERGIWN